MTFFKRVLWSCLLSLMFLNAASAADLGDSGGDEESMAPSSVISRQESVREVRSEVRSREGFYVRGDLGWDWDGGGSIEQQSLELGGGLGYRFSDLFRADVRFNYGFQYGPFPFGRIPYSYDIGSVLLTGYVDIPVGAVITPYVGVGGGYGWFTFSGALTGTESSFLGALMVGLSYPLTQHVVLDGGYRLRYFFEGQGKDHALLASVRYDF